MSHCVINLFETIEVQKEYSNFIVISFCNLDSFMKIIIKMHSVWQGGQ